MLAPDTYTLRVGASSMTDGTDDSFASGIAGWGVSFTVIPEPATALLIGLGLGVLGAQRQARSASRQAAGARSPA